MVKELSCVRTKDYHEKKSIYLIFKFLWLIVIIPKAFQFVVFALFAFNFVLMRSFKFKLPRCTKGIAGYIIVTFIAIFVYSLLYKPELSRILAALNTNIIWILALIFFTVFYNKNINLDIIKIGKYCFINLTALFLICIFTYILHLYQINLGFETRYFWVDDWINDSKSLRFQGLFEYSALVGFFVLFSFPFAFFYVIKKHRLLFLLLIVFAYVPVLLTKSRMSIVMGLAEIAVSCYWYVRPKILKSKKINEKFVLLILVSFVLILFLFNYTKIINLLISFIEMRGGSNNTRSSVYGESIRTVLNYSPFFGVGVKLLRPDGIPLGSHSTYLGIFYKSGIIGSICFVYSLLYFGYLHAKMVKTRKSFYEIYIILNVLFILLMCVLEDIDGSNWLLVLFFIVEAVFLNPNFDFGKTR